MPVEGGSVGSAAYKILMPAHSRMVVAVPMKRRWASSSPLLPLGCECDCFAAGRDDGVLVEWRRGEMCWFGERWRACFGGWMVAIVPFLGVGLAGDEILTRLTYCVVYLFIRCLMIAYMHHS